VHNKVPACVDAAECFNKVICLTKFIRSQLTSIAKGWDLPSCHGWCKLVTTSGQVALTHPKSVAISNGVNL